MDSLFDERQQDKSHLSEWIVDSDKNTLCNKQNREYILNSFNDYSELKQNYNNTQLKNISINFGFPNTRNTYKYQNTYSLIEFPMFEQRNVFYYDKDFKLFKNKSVSKYGEKKNKNNANLSQYSKNNRIFSPQHKIITSIKKKKYVDENGNEKALTAKKDVKNENDVKDEKDIYELEVINQVLFDDEDIILKKKGPDGKNSPEVREIESEWGEIEQDIYENEKDKKNNLLNSVYVEIEKENGDKQYKVLEFTKEEKPKEKIEEDPCIKIKYTVEDKICCTNAKFEPPSEQYSLYDKDTKDTAYRSLNNRNYANSTSNINNSIYSIKHPSLRKENVSEVVIKDSKSNQNLLSSSENDKNYFSGNVSSIKKLQKYSTTTSNNQDLTDKAEKIEENEKRIDSIKPISHKFEEEYSPINRKKINKGIIEVSDEKNKNKKLIDIIVENEGQDNDLRLNEQKKQKNFFEENKEKIKDLKQKEKDEQERLEREIREEKKPVEEGKEMKRFVRKFRDQEEEPEKKEMIIDRNKIIKEKRYQEKEIEKERDKRINDRYNTNEEEIGQSIRDKYRKKVLSPEEKEDTKAITQNNIIKYEKPKMDEIDKNKNKYDFVSKSQVLKEDLQNEKPYSYSRRFLTKKDEEVAKKETAPEKKSKYRSFSNQDEEVNQKKYTYNRFGKKESK